MRDKMNLNRTPNPLDRDARNKENENWDRLENKTRAIDDKLSDIVNVVSDEAMEKIIDKITINWKGPVDSFEDLPEDAEVGDAHYVYDDKQVYRYDGENWIDITMIDLSPVEEVDSRLTAEIETLDAKVDNNEEEFNQHVESKNNPHEVTKSQVGLSNVDNVKQASKTEFNQHKDNKTNPHNVTKSQVGLGNVDNVKQATKSEFDQFKGDTETQLTNTEQDLSNHESTTVEDGVHGLIVESGTFTPELRFGGNSVGVLYKTQRGLYTRIGEIVHIQISIELTSKGTSIGNASLEGIPFSLEYSTAGTLIEFNRVDMPNNAVFPILRLGSNLRLLAYQLNNGTLKLINDDDFNSDTALKLNMTYKIAEGI